MLRCGLSDRRQQNPNADKSMRPARAHDATNARISLPQSHWPRRSGDAAAMPTLSNDHSINRIDELLP
jgi:hypothetical protein